MVVGNKEHDAIARRGLEVQGASMSVHELIKQLKKHENDTNYSIPVVVRFETGRTATIYLIKRMEMGSLLSSPFIALDVQLHVIQSTARCS